MRNFCFKSAGEAGWFIFAAGFMLLVLMFFGLIKGPVSAALIITGIGASAIWYDRYVTPAKVDPWELQRELMIASKQQMPSTAMVTRTTVLYLALCLEELAEAMQPVAATLGDFLLNADKPVLRPTWATNPPGVRLAHDCLVDMAPQLDLFASQLRAASKRMTEFAEFPMSVDQAIEFADGVTDMMVVVAGATLSAGLPGAALYADVVNSNLSKRNPNTGQIDVDRTGKWIKGVDYVAPDLHAVLITTGTLPPVDVPTQT